MKVFHKRFSKLNIISIFFLPSLIFIIDFIFRISFLSNMKSAYILAYIVSYIFEITAFYFIFLLQKTIRLRFITLLLSVLFAFFQLSIYSHYLYFGIIPNFFSINFMMNDINYTKILFYNNINLFHIIILIFLSAFYFIISEYFLNLVKIIKKRVSLIMVSILCISGLIINNNVKRHPGNFGAISNTLFTVFYVIQQNVFNSTFKIKKGAIKREFAIKNIKKTSKDFNILLIISESIRHENLHYYGYHRKNTPFIDSLIDNKSVILFENHYSNTNSTGASIPCILSGTIKKDNDPSSIFVYDYLKNWTNLKTFLLSSHSYHGTLHYFNSNLDEFIELNNSGLNRYNDNGFDDHKLINILDKTIDNNCHDDNFFGILQFNNTHSPYKSHHKFKHYKPSKDNSLNAYDNSIVEQDYLIKQVFSVLERKKILDSTIIIFTSDHGECFNEHGHFGHLNCLYNQETLVPFWIYLPNKIEENIKNILLKNSKKFTNHLDIFPTILSLYKFSDSTLFSNKIEGKSLLKEIPKNRIIKLFCNAIKKREGLIYNKHKLISSEGLPIELFDLRANNFEENNIWNNKVDSVKNKYINLLKKCTNPYP